MNKEEIFSVWAPDESPWSRWVKPVLFAYFDSGTHAVPNPEPPGEASWAPAPEERVALVLDLPGAEGVWTGIALASRGYRPIPLYNAIPLPFGESAIDPVTSRPVAAVNVLPILVALCLGADQLAGLTLPDSAPPAFLLDANRAADGRKLGPGEFDNRSISFTTDFPSAIFLASQGIQRALLVQEQATEPRPDLAHTLRRWQDGAIQLERLSLDDPGRREPLAVARPSWYGAMFQRALASFGLRRAGGGGFGAWIPDQSAGG